VNHPPTSTAENQTDQEAIAEDEAAYHSATVTMMAVPVELVPAV
jgi:hypothetical protein